MEYGKRNKIRRDLWNFVIWFAVGYGAVELGKWLFPSFPPEAITSFFIGGFVTFIGLSVYGIYLEKQQEHLRQAAMDQFVFDQKADVEQQATIDKEIIDQLRNEHKLSGEEQDERLKALETALKHLRGK